MNKIKSLALGLVIATGSLVVTNNQAQAAFLNGTFSGVPFGGAYNVTDIRTDGSDFSFGDGNFIVSSTSGDFTPLGGTNTGAYYGTTYTQTSVTIPGQAWRYSGTPTAGNGLYFEFLNFNGSGNTLTFTAFDDPATYGLTNNSTSIPFSGQFGTLPGGFINGIFSLAGFDDTAGTLSFACTYSQNVAGPNPESGTCTAAFAALGTQPTSTPEPASVLGLVAVAGLAGMSSLKKVKK